MSKRPRLSSEEAKRAGLNAWETNDGRRWLMKSLNPNDVAITSTGIPSLSSRNISVLNWQGEYTVSVPKNLDATVPNYDATMFLYQHPLIFGMSAARPQGTLDFREFDGRFNIWMDTNNDKIGIRVGEQDSSAPIALCSCSQYLNKQISPASFGQEDNLDGKVQLFRKLTQKNRICYGGATIIPTCADDDNSGSIAVCQQIFNPRKTVMVTNNDIELDTFQEDDFPDTSDTVQNPQMYYGRFQDGAYIPYKLVDPLTSDYVNSETQVITRAPYFVTAISLLLRDIAVGQVVQVENPEFGKVSSGLNAKFDVSKYIVTSTNPDTHVTTKVLNAALLGVRFSIMTFTGQKGYFTMTLADLEAGKNTSFYTTQVIAQPLVSVARGANTPWIEGSALTVNNYDINFAGDGVFFKLPKLLTLATISDGKELSNPYGLYYVGQDGAKTATWLNFNPICPYDGTQLVTIHMSGVSNTAPIKMILRYGVEILLTASSIYSPFKFMSPKYDESAIKSYARCIRNMKDAYFANAGSTVGQVDFVNKILNLIETDVPDDLRVLNQGGQWTGVVV